MSEKTRINVPKGQAFYTPLNPPSRGDFTWMKCKNSPLEEGQGGVTDDAASNEKFFVHPPKSPFKGGLSNSPLEGGQGGVRRFAIARNAKHNPENQARKNTSGYILLEALLAILLLSVGMLAVAQAYHRAMYAMQLQQHYLTPAKALAESLLAEQELQALSGLAMDDAATTGQQGRFHFRIDFKDWRPAPGLQQVQVTVSWNDRGKPGSLTLSAILPRKQAML